MSTIAEKEPKFVNAFNDLGIIVGYYWWTVDGWRVRVRETNIETDCRTRDECEDILRRHRAKTFRVHH